MLHQSRTGPAWLAVLGSVLGLVVLAALGVGEYAVYRMSDPEDALLVGIRIDGARISVKAPVCPADTVKRVDVYDSRSEKPLWRATGPKTTQAKRGAITLWAKDAFLRSAPDAEPRRLPKELDISVEYADGNDGTGNVFNISEVMALAVPEGQYWTYDGPMTARRIDAQLKC
ncbi:hypothetical protein ACWGQ5_36435 [Streptomyces sp. NPDC055722]